VNKVDTGDRLYDMHQFHSLGLGELWPIASANGSGTGDLLDKVIELLPQKESAPESEKIPRIAIVGKPNVGKSSMTNALLGEERNIVTPIPGTTRDPISSHYNKYGHNFILIDTAGLRRKSRVHEDLEFYSVMRAIRVIEGSDVSILMIDAQDGIEQQDLSIFKLIIKNRKGCIIVVNKWDLIENKESNTMRDYRSKIYDRIAPFVDLPILFTSVTNKQRIMELLDESAKVYANRNRRVATSELNNFMLEEISKTPPPALKGKYIKIKYVTQLPTATPSFAFFCNLPQYIREDYKRFLENKLRSRFDFSGVPIQIYFRKK
ncbi:MAG: ribosome biogenesis GTPase Der, partial [Bacteroidales bacterium]